MAIAEDLDAIFSDLAVSATAGTVTGSGVLDEPTSVVLGDNVLFVDYQFFCKTSDFGTLKAGDAITINSVAYTVREAQLDSDSLITILSVQKT